MDITYKTFTGNQVKEYLSQVSLFRSKYFEEFPYLYVNQSIDSAAKEEEYIASQATDTSYCIVSAFDGSKLVGISTGLALVNGSDLSAENLNALENSNINPKDCFYSCETIILPEYRGKGIYKKLCSIKAQYAIDLGFTYMLFISVVREDNHPLKPDNYISHNAKWNNMGFQKTNLFMHYDWHTKQADGSVVEQSNKLEIWYANLEDCVMLA